MGEKYMVVDFGGECLIVIFRVILISEKKFLVCNDGVYDIYLKKYIFFFLNIWFIKLVNFKKNLF